VRTTYGSVHEHEHVTSHEAGLGGGVVEHRIWQVAHEAIAQIGGDQSSAWEYRGPIGRQDIQEIQEMDAAARRMAREEV
jgi:hypothetical protein